MTAATTRSTAIPTHIQQKLEALVDQIVAKPGDLIDSCAFREQQDNLNVAMLVASLPEGMDEADLIGILKLALLTECATESYAKTIRDVAINNDAGWLGRFNERVWTPDELTHHLPYKLILQHLGFNEAELDREIKETQEKHYFHHGGGSVVQMTTFAMIQEYLTDGWHGMVSTMLRPASAEAANMVLRVKRRETLHCVWYRDMTALLIEANPNFVDEVAAQVEQFHMPGVSLVPELQANGIRWQTQMGIDFEATFRDLFRLVQDTLGNARLTGRLVMKLASDKHINLGPVPVRVLDAALSRLGAPGYGIVGEAALERVGLSYMFEKREGKQDSAFKLYDQTYERIRSLLRTWIAEALPPPAKVVLRI